MPRMIASKIFVAAVAIAATLALSSAVIPALGGTHATSAKKKKPKRGPAGPQGPPGPQGAQGPQGPPGADAAANVRRIDFNPTGCARSVSSGCSQDVLTAGGFTMQAHCGNNVIGDAEVGISVPFAPNSSTGSLDGVLSNSGVGPIIVQQSLPGPDLFHFTPGLGNSGLANLTAVLRSASNTVSVALHLGTSSNSSTSSCEVQGVATIS